MVDPGLGVATVVSGLAQPIAMAFLAGDDFLVTEKASGQVKRVTNGVMVGVVLDLAVNSASERGLLGIALHPQFPSNPGVYLFNTESTTGADTTVLSQTPLLGHRVDRYVWNGSTLVFDHTIIRLRAFQEDLNGVTDPLNPFNNPAPVQRGNHNGGVIRFGQDGKLYIISGDTGRRGWLQNNFAGPVPDDGFGGPVPDNAHTTGVIRRLNDDGSIPADNPMVLLGTILEIVIGGPLGQEIGNNVQRLFAFGVRNSFGMTFDPFSGDLWTTENGGRAFDEINRVPRGFNGGWIQLMGPLARVADYREIEVGVGIGGNGPVGLQQLRWPAEFIATTPAEASQRLISLPGVVYTDPQFSWKHVTPPAGLGFIGGTALGLEYCGNLIVGSAVFRPVLAAPSVLANPGHLYRFRLNAARTSLVFTDPALQDRVADNLGRDDWVTEQQEILFGTDFGIVTDIQTGPDGNLYLVGTSSGTVRKIFKP
ncbi:MAG: PQQ-dependent sugar dehydrogenase [Planctomycetota bacterium]